MDDKNDQVIAIDERGVSEGADYYEFHRGDETVRVMAAVLRAYIQDLSEFAKRVWQKADDGSWRYELAPTLKDGVEMYDSDGNVVALPL